MNILWVKVGGLWPLHTGGRLRSFHLLSELSHRHRITVLTTHGAGEDAGALAEQLPRLERVRSVPHLLPKRTSARFAVALLRSWCSPYPVDLWRCRIPALRREVDPALAGGSYDLCVADFLAATPNVPLQGPVPVVFFAHNVEHLIWKRLTQHERRAWRRPALELEWRKMRHCEARACRRARLTVAVSETDRRLLGALAPSADIRSIPTGVDTSYFSPRGSRAADHELVFVGSLDWYPNEDAVLFFIERVLPAIRAEVPDATVTVVGRSPSDGLRMAAAAAGVRVTGTVDDVRPYVARAAVFVVPLRIGSGTRLKIFEALAMAKPVVSTTVGAEGLSLDPGVHFLRADGPGDFARAAVSLLRDPDRRRELGAAGRHLVATRYSWPQVARAFDACCEDVLRVRSTRPMPAAPAPALDRC